MKQIKIKRLLAVLCILTLIPISSFGSKAEEDGATELVNWSIRDVFMTDGNYGFEFDNNRAGIPNGTLENTRFSTIFRLDALEDADTENDIPPYINFWIGEQEHGLVFQMLDTTGATLNLIWIDANGETALYETLYAENIGLPSFYGIDIRMDVEMVSGAKNIFLGGEGLFHTRITGPGKVYIQSMPVIHIAERLTPYIKINTGSDNSGGINIKLGD